MLSQPTRFEDTSPLLLRICWKDAILHHGVWTLRLNILPPSSDAQDWSLWVVMATFRLHTGASPHRTSGPSGFSSRSTGGLSMWVHSR